ncbi:MAG: amidohydrolase family protein [Thermodesulfobacteriota bacterium]
MSDPIFDLAITGDILQPDHVVRTGVLLVEGEKIVRIADEKELFQARRHYDARGRLVLPGVIDSHVHSFSYPGEGFANATRAACAGGATTIIDMPVDAPKGIATPAALAGKISLAETESHVDLALLASVKNETLDQIPALAAAGACGFKLSLFDTEPDRFPRVHDGHLLEAFRLIGRTGLTAGVHAENDEIIKYLIAQALSAGRTHPRAHLETRPEVTETESVLKALEIARAAGVRLHLHHLSCSRSVELAALYQAEGGLVSLETCPHYLLFSAEDLDRLGARLRINPPVRSRKESEALWRALGQGRIDCVGSDHAPWPLEYKSRPSIFDNASGTPGVETLLTVLFSEGVVKGRITVPVLSRVLSENPSRLFGLFPRKGVFLPGSDADVVILNPEEKWTIAAGQLKTAVGWTPYEGLEVTGKVTTTIIRGRIVYHQGEILGEKGFGRFLRPSKP